jgi:Chaperone of endosialidase
MKQPIGLKYLILTLLVLVCFALSPQARAVCQQGCDIANLNTHLGDDVLAHNQTGHNNTATGYRALYTNTEGGNNTANGSNALLSNTIGSANTAIGVYALVRNTTGYNNTASGYGALVYNTNGYNNTANGISALFNNETGIYNTANGSYALLYNTVGNNNTATGYSALYRTTGSGNIALGFQAGLNLTTGSNNIDIGNAGVAGESGRIRIGTAGAQTATLIAGIYNVSEGGTIKPVYINSNGRLGTQPPASARKFKEEIKAMEKTSEEILKLKPVTFRYKNDAERTPQFGLIAEEVANVNPDLVVRDENGEIYTVRYEAVNAMLLNEFLKEHRKNEEQQATIAQLKCGMEALIATLKEQTSQIQKVTAQLEVRNPAPRVVNNP